MEEDRRSRTIAVSGSLLLHVVIAFLLLRLPLMGNDSKQSGRASDSVTVVTLVSPDSMDESGIAAPADSASVDRTEAPESAVALPVSRKLTSGSETPQGASSSDALTDSSQAGTGVQAPTGEDIRIYQRALLVHIERYRGYPLDEHRQRIEGGAMIRFAMDRRGKVLDVWIDRSSGVAALDTEALATVRRAQPLPMIPASLPDRLSIVLPVSFSVQ